LIVVAADKLQNQTAIERDLEQLGETLWSRFNATPDLQRWYYDSVIEILNERLDNPIVCSLNETYARVRPQMVG
jgi:hypothetical protein